MKPATRVRLQRWSESVAEFCADYLLPLLLIIALFGIGMALSRLARAADPQLLCWSWPANDKAGWYRIRVDGRTLPVMYESKDGVVKHCEASASWNVKCAEVRAISRRWEGWDSPWSAPCCGKIGSNGCITEEVQ